MEPAPKYHSYIHLICST